MRIVQLIPSLDVGGAERMAALLALGLARLGHQVRLISLYNSSGSWIERDCVDQGLPLEFLGKKPGLDPSMVRRLGHSLRQWRPDIVHSHLHSLKYLLPARLFWRRCRIVHTVHNLAQHEIELHGRLIHHLAFRSGVVPVAIGAAVAQSLREVYRIPIHESIPN
ncbi:MAG TPA: glycosyltransferase, partial [Myxococcota bacterium]|nr:glycosyltransferase [Myxococcota bacterium]